MAESDNEESGVYLSLTPERALAAADRVDPELAARAEVSPLAGVPLAVKDVIMTRGEKTTCASRTLEHFIAPYDATAIERVERAGAVIIGKTNCDEFAMGSSNENSAYCPVRNPAAPARVPGGSSGGYTPISLGSDTGGSTRQPASFCGAVGIMPTYGRVSRYGLVAFASSLGRIGPFSRTVKDSALLLGTISRPDPLDSTAANALVPDYAGELSGQVQGLKIGIPKEYYGEGLESAVGAKVEAGLDRLNGLGCEAVELSLPHTRYAIASYYLICTAEANSNLAGYDGVRYSPRSESSGTLRDMYLNSTAEGRGDAPDRSWQLRAEFRLLRRLLPEGARSSRTDCTRFRRSVQIGGRDHHTRIAVSRIQARREDQRPTSDVPVRYLHDHGQPSGHRGDERALRQDTGRAAGRHADPDQPLPRADHAQSWLCIQTGRWVRRVGRDSPEFVTNAGCSVRRTGSCQRRTACGRTYEQSVRW